MVLKDTIQFFPTYYQRYVEPFLGGGAILLHLQAAKASATDSNTNLINFYFSVKTSPIQLTTIIGEMIAEYTKLPKAFYLETRKHYNNNRDIQDVNQAARFFFLNKACFNGLYRVNRSGEFNVPFGGPRKLSVNLDHFVAVSDYLGSKCVDIGVSDFKEVLGNCGSGDLVFLDPPYIHEKGFTSYSSDSFGKKDYEVMVELSRMAISRGAKFVISNSLDDTKMFSGFKQNVIERSTSISGFANVRIKSPEYVYTSGW